MFSGRGIPIVMIPASLSVASSRFNLRMTGYNLTGDYYYEL